ncbi:MAG: NUDIX hydrolase [Bryobacterales bacterium]|nr:NUDIX hydrolase [Bryobacterales bacterium]
MSRGPATIGAGRFLRLVRRGAWEYVERIGVRDVAVLVPITDRGEIVLVEQFRIPVQARMVELPAGLVGDEPHLAEEGLLEAANRELEEETGYRAANLEVLVQAPSSGGMTSEVVSFVSATGLERVGEGGGVDGEDIVVHRVPLGRASAWLWERQADGCLIDPKIFAGLYLVHMPCARFATDGHGEANRATAP